MTTTEARVIGMSRLSRLMRASYYTTNNSEAQLEDGCVRDYGKVIEMGDFSNEFRINKDLMIKTGT